MLIKSRSLWVGGTNTYVVAQDSGGPCVIIDAPPDPEAVARLLADNDLYPEALLLTHGHVDHCGGAGHVVDQFSVVAYVHPEDDFLTLHPGEQMRMLFGGTPPDLDLRVPEYKPLADGDRLEYGGVLLEVLHTPGHTPGHCCFHAEGFLFSGDQLFAGSIGRTDLQGGSYDQLMKSMEDKVLSLADDTEVLPGHGPATTLGRERLTNPFLQ